MDMPAERTRKPTTKNTAARMRRFLLVFGFFGVSTVGSGSMGNLRGSYLVILLKVCVFE